MKNKNSQEKNPHLLRGVVAGVVGGLAASWVMNVFLTGASKAQEALQTPEEKEARAAKQGDDEDSTIKVANAFVKATTGKALSEEQKQKSGPMVHYAFGAIMGGVYGGVAEYSAASRLGLGTLFGSALFLGADEIAVPALGLAPWPTQAPISGQATHWVAHLVYGATVEIVRRAVRTVL